MTDTQFCNGFWFRLLHFSKYNTSDCTKSGSPKHYFARMVRGTGKICTANGTLHLKPGDVFFIPNKLRYRSHWYPDAGGHVQFYSFAADVLPSNEKYSLQIVPCTKEELAVLSLIEHDLASSPRSVGRLYDFFGMVSGKMQRAENTASDRLLNAALAHIRQTPQASAAQIAARCGISESGLYLLFRRHLHQTPVAVRHRVLAEQATELLTTTDLPIEEISTLLGFSSSTYFRKILRTEIGKTPSEIRKSANHV